MVTFENIPEHLENVFYFKDNTRAYNRNEILFFSQKKEDCEIFLETNKYNL